MTSQVVLARHRAMGLAENPPLWEQLRRKDNSNEDARKVIDKIQKVTLAKIVQLEVQWGIKKAKKGNKGPPIRALINSLGTRCFEVRKIMKKI